MNNKKEEIQSQTTSGQVEHDPHIKELRRGRRVKIPNRKFTTDYVK